MPRSNRPRRQRSRAQEEPDIDLARALTGWQRTEVKRGRSWRVQPISEQRAIKSYSCPGCARTIEPGTAHLVAWQADGVLGDEADIAGRRHWHVACWKVH